MNKKDLKLIFELDSNSRASYSKIGKKIRMSEQLISYKIKSFQKKGVIQGVCPLIDYSRFSLLAFLVFFKVRFKSEQSYTKLLEELKGHENVLSIMESDGKYDLLVIFASKNPSSFNKKLKILVSDYPQLKDWMILTSVVDHHYLRNYLLGKDGESDVILGGDRDEVPVDDLDFYILHALIMGKRTILEIAEYARSSPKTILIHLKWLQEQHVLKGYRLLLNTRRMEISSNAILIKYRHITAEQEDEFRHFCKRDPNIIQFTKTFGEWDGVLYIETKNRVEFRRVSLQLRERFDDIIEDIDNFRIFAIPKKQFLPSEILLEPS